MLNNNIHSHISHNYNNINKLYFLNKQRENKNRNKTKEKYNSVHLDKQNYFNVSNNMNVNIMNKSRNNSLNIRKNLKTIKKIHNVYKINFKNAPATGFGDFIRGCYYLLEFSEKYNVTVDFHIYDSTIKNYLKYFYLKPNINEMIANNINKYTDINSNFINNNGVIDYIVDGKTSDFINYLYSQPVYNNNSFINTINFPLHIINKQHINRMKTILEPTYDFNIEIDNIMYKLGLIKNDYITYHIRLGDNFLENQFELIQNNKLCQIIDKIYVDDNNNYLLISDSVLIKNILTEKYPKLKILHNDIVHISQNNDADKVKNTLIDFYLMSYSKNIISFSIYMHGSGFSKWCAKTYDIPYICYLLN
jgi:hypothetical protein